MRLFTALRFDDETKNALSSVQKKAEEHAKGSFSQKENLHLTLVFIGETERKDDIEKALSQIDFSSFRYKISGLGTFEKGIFWAGIEENENLKKLQGAVKAKLDEIGVETEEREYIPHITLARKFRPEADFDFSSAEELLPKNIQNAAKISLMKSELTEGILKYTEVYSKNLI